MFSIQIVDITGNPVAGALVARYIPTGAHFENPADCPEDWHEVSVRKTNEEGVVQLLGQGTFAINVQIHGSPPAWVGAKGDLCVGRACVYSDVDNEEPQVVKACPGAVLF